MEEAQKDIQSYEEFWPFYLKEHSNPINRILHYIGTSLGLCVMAYAIYSAQYALILVGLVCGYVFAWIGHFIIEKNRPATFKYPFWSFISDFRMLFCAATGQLSKNYKKN